MDDDIDMWVDKYRPKEIGDYVFKNPKQKQKVLEWIANKKIPHLLLSGVQGSGKTSLARLLFAQMNVDPFDILDTNASKANGVDAIRNNITNFVSTLPKGTMKYVLLDEADRLSHDYQLILRGVMEQYSESSRFILTCNYPSKILPSIHSRCKGYHFDALEMEDFILRIVNILEKENVTFDFDDLDSFIRTTYPDMRKCINTLQENVINGVLTPTTETGNSTDFLLGMVELFKTGKISQARKLITSQAEVEQYEDIYKFFYKNLDLFGETEEHQEEAILLIAKGLRDHTLSADPEINLSATLVSLSRIKNG